MKLETWNAGALSTLCVVLGAIAGFLWGGLLAPPVAGEIWFRTYQPLIGATIGVGGALFGLYIATQNVLRQMRMNLMSREEDRLDALVPNLREAKVVIFEVMSRTTNSTAQASIGEALEQLGYTTGDKVRQVVASKMPNAEAPLITSTAVIVRRVVGTAKDAFIPTVRFSWSNEEQLAQRQKDMARWREALEVADAHTQRLQGWIADAEKKKMRFREEIERHLR